MTTPPYPVKGTTFDEKLDGVLREWYDHFRRYTYGGKQGHRNGTGATGDYIAPGHMDWWNGSEDERADEIRKQWIAEAVDAVPNEPEPWHTALIFHARNLWIGRVIWDSPRLPVDREERGILILEARNLLATELHKRKVRL
jgi:hypothetical protein